MSNTSKSQHGEVTHTCERGAPVHALSATGRGLRPHTASRSSIHDCVARAVPSSDTESGVSSAAYCCIPVEEHVRCEVNLRTVPPGGPRPPVRGGVQLKLASSCGGNCGG